MNIDLTAEELGRIVQWAEAANMADPLTASLHLKALRHPAKYQAERLRGRSRKQRPKNGRHRFDTLRARSQSYL